MQKITLPNSVSRIDLKPKQTVRLDLKPHPLHRYEIEILSKMKRKRSFFDQNHQPLNSLLSLTPVKLSADGSWVIDPVDSATIEVRVSTEAKLDSAGSDACDSKCNWGGLMLFIPENVSAIARTLEALSITAVTRALDALFMIVLRTWRQAVRTVIAMRGLSVFVTASLMSTVGMWQLAGWTLRQ